MLDVMTTILANHELVLLLGIIILVLKDPVFLLLSKTKSIKLGPVEIDSKDTVKPAELLEELRQENNKANESILGSLSHICSNMKYLTARFETLDKDQMRLIFYNDNIPTIQRMFAGLRYIHLHGNGSCKADIKAFVVEHSEMYDSICFTNSELRLQDEKESGEHGE